MNANIIIINNEDLYELLERNLTRSSFNIKAFLDRLELCLLLEFIKNKNTLLNKDTLINEV